MCKTTLREVHTLGQNAARGDGRQLGIRAVGTGDENDGHLRAEDDAGVLRVAEQTRGLADAVADLIVRDEQNVGHAGAGGVVVLVVAGLDAHGQIQRDGAADIHVVLSPAVGHLAQRVGVDGGLHLGVDLLRAADAGGIDVLIAERLQHHGGLVGVGRLTGIVPAAARQLLRQQVGHEARAGVRAGGSKAVGHRVHGDEGKGRVIDLLAENADVVARYQGGNNAGHTVVTEKGKFILNLLPSGILHPDVTCVLGTGMVIDLDHLSNEMQAIEARGVEIGPKNLKLSDKATISMPWHKVQDGLEEDRLAKKGSAFGSTRRGIAYAYSDKYRKKTLRLGDLLHLDEERTQNRLHMILDSKNMELAGCYHQEKMSYDALLDWCRTQAERFAPFICDVGAFLQQAHDSGKRIVLEAQLGAMRDIDYGIFPFTSSSNTLAAYAPLGAGIPNCRLDHVVGVLKAYSTCVGAGPFAAEHAMDEDWNEQLRKAGGEYGAATGRPRRVGPFDCVASRYGLACQGADKIALTKLDVLSSMNEIPVITGYKLDGVEVPRFDTLSDLDRMEPVVTMLPGWNTDLSGCKSWDELPKEAKGYVAFLEKQLDHEIQFISTGAEREKFVLKGEWL